MHILHIAFIVCVHIHSDVLTWRVIFPASKWPIIRPCSVTAGPPGASYISKQHVIQSKLCVCPRQESRTPAQEPCQEFHEMKCELEAWMTASSSSFAERMKVKECPFFVFLAKTSLLILFSFKTAFCFVPERNTTLLPVFSVKAWLDHHSRFLGLFIDGRFVCPAERQSCSLTDSKG